MYALYKGEEILGMGSIRELAEKLKVKENTIRFYGSNTYKKRTKGNNARRLIRI